MTTSSTDQAAGEREEYEQWFDEAFPRNEDGRSIRYHATCVQDLMFEAYQGGKSTAPTTGSAPVAWMRTYRQFSDRQSEAYDPGYMVTSFHQNADFAAKYPGENVPLYAAPASPEASVLTDEQILALNAGEVFFSETPTRYPEAGHGTQYHAGAPGVIKFARAVAALLAASMGGDRT